MLRDGGQLLRERGDKLLCGLVVGVVGRVEIGELVVERLFDVVEGVVVFDNVGGAVVPRVASSCSTGDEAEVVSGGKVRFECVPCAVHGRLAFPFR